MHWHVFEFAQLLGIGVQTDLAFVAPSGASMHAGVMSQYSVAALHVVDPHAIAVEASAPASEQTSVPHVNRSFWHRGPTQLQPEGGGEHGGAGWPAQFPASAAFSGHVTSPQWMLPPTQVLGPTVQPGERSGVSQTASSFEQALLPSPDGGQINCPQWMRSSEHVLALSVHPSGTVGALHTMPARVVHSETLESAASEPTSCATEEQPTSAGTRRRR
jgi:hypothetical protein